MAYSLLATCLKQIRERQMIAGVILAPFLGLARQGAEYPYFLRKEGAPPSPKEQPSALRPPELGLQRIEREPYWLQTPYPDAHGLPNQVSPEQLAEVQQLLPTLRRTLANPSFDLLRDLDGSASLVDLLELALRVGHLPEDELVQGIRNYYSTPITSDPAQQSDGTTILLAYSHYAPERAQDIARELLVALTTSGNPINDISRVQALCTAVSNTELSIGAQDTESRTAI